MSGKRNFTCVVNGKEHGTYTGSSPSSAARKVVSKMCGHSSKKVDFYLREITQGSKKKVYGPYKGQMEKLKTPIELKGRTINYKPVVKLAKKAGGAFNFPVVDQYKWKLEPELGRNLSKEEVEIIRNERHYNIERMLDLLEQFTGNSLSPQNRYDIEEKISIYNDILDSLIKNRDPTDQLIEIGDRYYKYNRINRLYYLYLCDENNNCKKVFTKFYPF